MDHFPRLAEPDPRRHRRAGSADRAAPPHHRLPVQPRHAHADAPAADDRPGAGRPARGAAPEGTAARDDQARRRVRRDRAAREPERAPGEPDRGEGGARRPARGAGDARVSAVDPAPDQRAPGPAGDDRDRARRGAADALRLEPQPDRAGATDRLHGDGGGVRHVAPPDPGEGQPGDARAHDRRPRPPASRRRRLPGAPAAEGSARRHEPVRTALRARHHEGPGGLMSWFSFGRKVAAPDRSDVAPAFSLERNGARPGRPLESGVGEAMGAHFGADFSGVRIHDDPASGRLATAFGAAAFSVGSRVAFAPGAYAPETRAGRRLLGHELAHTLQQTEAGEESPRVLQPGEPAEREAEAAGRAVAEGRAARVGTRTGLQIARQTPTPAQPAGPPAWHKRLDEILPTRGGLVAYMGRIQTLLDVFGEPGLVWLVDAIYVDPAARKLVKDSGVSGMLALGDTVVGGKIDAAAAAKELAADPKRYRQPPPPGLRISIGPALQPPAPAVWFGEGGAAAPGQGPTTARSGIFVEPPSALSRIPAIPAASGFPGVSGVTVRFAFPQSEIGPSGTSSKVTRAKTAILRAIAQLAADLASFPGGTAAEVRGQRETRARLKEALGGFDDAHPLNVFIATLESGAELGAEHPPP